MEKKIEYLQPNLDAIIKKINERLVAAPKLTMSGHDLKFEIGEVDEVDGFFTKKAEEELRETPENVAQGYKELKELLAGEPDLHFPDDEKAYKLFLRPCKWYAKSAFSLIKRFFRFRQTYAHIFTNHVASLQKEALCAGVVRTSSIRCKDGARILLIEGGKRWKPKQVSLEQYFKGAILFVESSLTESKTQIGGVHVIFDMEGLTLSHVMYITPSFAKMLVEFIQKSIPCRIKSVHIVNQSFLFNMLYAIFKPFIEEKYRNRIFFHGKNWDKLIDIIGKEALFTKFGGEVEFLEQTDFGPKFWEILCSFDSFYEVINTCGYKTQNKK